MGKRKPWKGRGERSCVYCGKTACFLTAEHVFPKNLFPSPLPKTLITVPACEPCNKSYELDDEYFRFFAVTPAYEKELGRQIWDQKVMGSTLKRSPKLRAELVKSLRKIPITSPGGLYLGTRDAVLVEQKRIDRIFRKIARGLYRHHFGHRLRSDCPIDPKVNVNEAVLAASTLAEHLGPVIAVGDGSVARYRFADAPERPESSVWAVQLYLTAVSVIFVNADEEQFEKSHSPATI